MTVTISYAPLTYTCNGSTTAFSVTWPFFESTDLIVTRRTASGVETVLTNPADYTVTGGRATVSGTPAVGTVTTTSTYADGKIVITRNTSRRQQLALPTAGAFPAKSVEAALDRALMIAEEGVYSGTGDDVDGIPLRLETSGATDYWDGKDYVARGFADGSALDDLATVGQLAAAVSGGEFFTLQTYGESFPGTLIKGTHHLFPDGSLYYMAGDDEGNVIPVQILNTTTQRITISPATATYNVTVGQTAAGTFTASGGYGAYTYAVSGWPTGVTVSSAGVQSGAFYTSGTYTGTITATDTASSQTGTQSYTWIVAPALQISPASGIYSVASGTDMTGIAFNGSGGRPPLYFSQTGMTALGLSLSSTGVMSGTTTGGGTFSVTLTDSNGATTTNTYIYAATDALTLSPTTNVYNVTVGQTASGTITASGGSGTYTFTQTGYPPGISLSSGGTQSGTFSTAGTYTGVVTATDSSTGALGTQNYTWIVAPAVTLSPAAGTYPVAIGTNMTGVRFTGGGGRAPLVFTDSGLSALGLSISTTGVLSGTTTGVGSFTITVTDANGKAVTNSYTYTATGALTVSPSSASYNVTVGQTASGTFTASGGTGPYVFAVTGWPSGVTVSSGGTQSGTFTTPGSYTGVITASDTSTSQTGIQTYTWTVAPAVTLSPASGSYPVAVGTNMSGVSFTGAGGRAPLVFTSSGLAAIGLTMNTSGVLSGTTTGVGSFTITVTDANGKAVTNSYTYTATGALTVSPAGNTYNVTVGQVAGGTFTATGGSGSYTYSTSGWPAGVTVSSGGVQSGAFSSAGTYTGTITATDTSTGQTGTAVYTWIVAPALSLSPGSGTYTVAIGTNMAGVSFTGSGGRAPLYFSQTGMGAIGLSLNSSGVFSGTTTGHGTFSVTLTDSNGATVTQTYTYS